MIERLFWLYSVHALTDCALQTQWMGTWKSPRAYYVHPWTENHAIVWPYVMLAHALVNGLGVALVTKSYKLGIAETVSHFCIDLCSTMGIYPIFVDQALHALSKVVWALLW